jgi:hypothetical protein
LTPAELSQTLSAYASGLEAELALLNRVQQLSAQQQDASRQHDAERLRGIADERTRLMSGLVRIEHEIRSARQRLADHQRAAAALPGFDTVVRLHRKAAALVNDILAADQETMSALRAAEIARHEAAQAIEAGETTLNAYRRVLNPSAIGPSLVERRG